MRDSAAAAGLASLLEPILTMVDVGCRWGPDARWAALDPHLQFVGFDPDPVECRELAARLGNPRYSFVPAALGSSPGTRTLHVTAEPACSSLFPPDIQVIENRPSLAVANPVGTEEVSVVTLDDWLASRPEVPVDFIKVDTQGSELDVLRGASRALAAASAVEVEVEFNPIYKGQPLFGEVDAYLRDHGFVLWRLRDLTHYGAPGGLPVYEQQDTQYFDGPVAASFASRGGQLFWANAFYVRSDFAFPRTLDAATAARGVVVVETLGFWDLARTLAEAVLAGANGEMAAALKVFTR